jgi:lipoprotein-releasing system ATP-binding protein
VNSVILRLNNIKKKFNVGDICQSIVNDVNISLKNREIMCLIGPSGSGKSTILQIAGLISLPSSGEVYLIDERVDNKSDSRRTLLRRRHIGFIYQYHNLLSELDVISNVSIPLLLNGINRRDAENEAYKLLHKVGLSDKVNQYSNRLSGGEAQRVAISRAIVKRPVLILADEPTGNLDEKNSNIIADLIMSLKNDYNVAILIVTHDKNLSKIADKIMKIENGNIVECT